MSKDPRTLGTLNKPRLLQTRIGVSLGALILLLSLVMAIVLSASAEKKMVRISAENLENLSEQMARELTSGMHSFLANVVDQSVREGFTDPAAKPEAMRRALDQFKNNHPEFAYVSIVDIKTARVIAAGGGIFEGGNAAGRPTFEEGRKGPFLGDVHDAVRLAELLPKPENGEPLRFFDVATPIYDATGTAFRVFATHVSWQWTDRVREAVFGPVKERRGIEVFLLDTTDKVVLQGAPDAPVGTSLRSLIQASADPEREGVAWPNGGRYLTHVANVLPKDRFSGFGWKVVARLPYELAQGPARDLRLAFLAGALALGLAGIAIAWWLTDRLTQPLRALSDAARETSDPDKVRELHIDGTSEVSMVSQALTRLSDSAKEHERASQTKGRQFEVLCESLPQLVWQADAAGRLEYVNKQWLRAESNAGVVHVSDLEHLIHREDCPTFLETWQRCLASGQDLKVRCRLKSMDGGAHRWFDLEAHAVRDSEQRVTRWVGTIFDVHQIVSEAERAEKALDVERAARQEAERLTRMRDEFLATVSHELRSPLSAITAWSEILARKGGDDEMRKKASSVIRRNAVLQTRLIDDLLDMTAMLAGKLALNTKPLDVVSLAKDATLSHLHAAQKKGVALVCHDAPTAMVEGDPRRISQVLSNLIGNAVKFTDTGGRIDVTPRIDGSHVRVGVSDSGRGIQTTFLPYVFERLRQEDASNTRKAGGLGLGLAIAKAVIDLHPGGEIDVQSPGPGQGSTFTFSLPLAEYDDAKAPDDADLLRRQTDLSGLRALVVDDEQDAREVTQVALASLGAYAKSAASAGEALALLEHETFDFVVSDIGMPDVDGLTFIRMVRNMLPEEKRKIPAIALTAFALESERQAGLKAGFQSYVTKPISLTSLGQGISEAIGRGTSRSAI